MQGWYTLKEWRRPRKFRSVSGHYPRNIYQIDIAHFKTFFDKLKIPTTVNIVTPYPYGLVCIDVYSRFAWEVGIEDREGETIRTALGHIFSFMGKPETVDGDNEIISKIVKYPEFQGINWYVTSPHETNKNAIVERFIKTLNFSKILVDPNVKFSKTADLTTQLIHRACVMYNNRVHRIIQARPIDVFEGRDISKQEIIRFEYEEIPKDTIVLRKPFKEKIGVGVLDYDVELYVVEFKAGDTDKYYTAPLYYYVVMYLIKQGKLKEIPEELKVKMDEEGMLTRKMRKEKRGLTKIRRVYKPYELRVLSARELVDHVNSNLFKWMMTKKYGRKGYNRIKKYINEVVLR